MPEALPGLIRSVYTTLNGLGTEAPAAAKPEPAVPVKKLCVPGLHYLPGGRKRSCRC